jgi:hypothetical protein
MQIQTGFIRVGNADIYMDHPDQFQLAVRSFLSAAS